MKGKYSFSVSNSSVEFRITLNRNITILQGEGGTGKSVLCNMILDSKKTGSGVHLKAYQLEVRTLSTDAFNDGVILLHKHHDVVYIIDEDEQFVRSSAFAEQVKLTGCYVIIITREKLSCLPCSIKEVYTIATTYDSVANRNIKTLKPLYPQDTWGKLPNSVGCIITEDRGAGKQFFSRVYGQQCLIISANSKDNVNSLVEQHLAEPMIAVVDGAAYGFLIQDLLRYLSLGSLYVIAKESFEYVLLKSGILSKYLGMTNVEEPLVDSTEFFSWEAYYFSLIVAITKETLYSYKKTHLPTIYTTPANQGKILDVYKLPAYFAASAEITHFFS